MASICPLCGRANRASANFCLGCAARLPGFVATGPSALERLSQLHSRSGSVASATRTNNDTDTPAKSRAFFLRLGGFTAAMMIGFMGWYAWVSQRDAPPLRSQPPPQARMPLKAAEPEQTAAVEVPLENVAPAPGLPDARLPVEQHSAVSDSAQVAEAFYRALAKGDGRSAAEFIAPSRRGKAAFDPSSMSRFYGTMSQPLAVRNIRQIASDRLEVRYSYRVTRTACEGTAIVTTEVVSARTMIQSIRANC